MSSAPLNIDRQTLDEAVNRPLDFNPAERAKFIRKMLQEIPKMLARGDSEDTIRQNVPEFYDSYPELFKKIIKKEDLTPVNTMLTMLDKMAKGTLSQHQASIIVGQRLVDRYVKPQLSSTD